MNFIFEDDSDEVGSDVEAYCPKCKADTAHTVITKYEDEVRRVQCSPCSDVHTYRKPRGEIEDEIPEPVAAKKRATAKKPTWKEAIDRAGPKAVAHARPYSIRDSYREGDLVGHPKFGVGLVTEISENKVEMIFQDERRVLVHNRPDLAAQMPAIAQMPAPREDRRGKRRKAAKGAAAVAVQPAEVKKPVKPVKTSAAAASKPQARTIAKPGAKVAAKPMPSGRADAKAVQGKAARAKSAATKKGAIREKARVATPARKAETRSAPKRPRAARPLRQAAARSAAVSPKKLKAKKAGKAR